MPIRAIVTIAGLIVLTCSSAGWSLDSEPGTVRGEMRITNRPLVVTLRLGERLLESVRAALANPARATVRLELLGVVPPSDSSAINGLRVFLGKADATRKTPDEDLHYTGSIAFAPTGSTRTTQGFLVNITDALGRLVRRGGQKDLNEITVTVVPLMAEGHENEVTDVSLEEIKLTVRRK